ncbi:hypothetical protein UCRNP2_6723 [Neofusicoccum parvum UCRNP2]|uniref:Uncharacterized protein n=1 Tax=Botryosphaeria parva (strain UCR-NP2) TaxID=1287680 RepID=R1G563_BOTPV|nr:hypothetical protein UCRNP2_6723 [Neofusicoccum parvum UCRNP2]
MDPASLQRDLHLRSLAALPRDFRAETARLVRWITGLYSAADIVFERELLRLVHAAQRAEAGAAGPAAVEAFEREKARCAARVCYILGHCGVVPLCVAGEPASQA